VGIDNSEAQLATARRLQQQHGLHFPLHHGSAEAIPYPDQSFDFAIWEYGACLWADPERWVPEASRLLRPDGQLVFLTNSFLLTLCMPVDEGAAATDRLLRAAFGMRRVEWPNDPGIEFHLSQAIGCACCGAVASASKISSRYGLPSARRRAIRS
jgi:SAM-dependent methyltransferase